MKKINLNADDARDELPVDEWAGAVENFEDESDENQSENISFEDLGLDEITLEAIEKKGFVTPSPIQVLAIPRLLNGDANVIARARTGTGKTAAFGLPLVQSFREKSDCVKALILEPTRELAMQTCNEMASFTTGKFPRTCVVYGGASIGMQIRDLKRGEEIVVGTPGRVQDLMERGILDISKIEYFILDEGDEMLDMGFVEDIENIFSKANPDCRVLLFSATIPSEILKIAQKFMGDYEIVEEEGVVSEPLLIEQKYCFVREEEKIEALVRLIDIAENFYGLIFVQKKTDADFVAKALDERGYEAAALHGDIPQGQREKILSRFRNGKTRILVATDVAARGIDIEGLTHVVNYEIPFDGATYVHRIGRTGRAGSSGVAVTFVCPKEKRRLSYLRSAVQKQAKGQMVEEKIPSVKDVIAAKKDRLFKKIKEEFAALYEEELADGKNVADSVFEKDGAPKDDAGESSVVDKSAFAFENGLSSDEGACERSAAGGADFGFEKTVSSKDGSGESSEAGGAAFGFENTLSSKDDAKKVPSKNPFEELAEDLCKDKDAKEILALHFKLVYGKELEKKRYGKVTSLDVKSDRRDRDRNGRDRGGRFDRRGRDVFLSENQLRLYVQLGWIDGYNPKKIASYFSQLLKIQNKDVDAIDMADKFCLLTLPQEAAKKAIALSESNSKIPHMHLDTKSFKGKKSFSDESKSFSSGRNFSGKGRSSFAGKGGFSDREKRSRAKDSSHARKNVHTATRRSGQAALYKKSGVEEY